MSRDVYCLDSSVIVKLLVPEEGSEEAGALLKRALGAGGTLVAPAFAWAEVGSVLRKKVRTRLLTSSEANELWDRFVSLNIRFVDEGRVPSLAWKLAARHNLPTLYDAAFLAVAELAAEDIGGRSEFWTADQTLIDELGHARPEYVRLLQSGK